MKHIKKKFLEINTLTPEQISPDKATFIGEIKKEKEMISIISKDDGTNYMGFLYRQNRNDVPIIFCMPILPMVFYDNAYQSYLLAKEKRAAILNKMSNLSTNAALPEHEIYLYIGFATSSVIMMCVALENFVNEQIARLDFTYEIETTKKRGI